MVNGMDWSIVLDAGAGVGALLVGIGVLVAGLGLARTLRRVNGTLDVLDEQITAVGKPIGQTLDHLGGIADTADQTLARLRGVADSLEGVAASAAQTAELAKGALGPAIINIGATIAGVSAGLRRIVTGKTSTGEP